MKLSDIKSTLKAHDLYEWQLAKALGINKSTFNSWSHDDFSGHESEVKKSLRQLLGGNSDDVK